MRSLIENVKKAVENERGLERAKKEADLVQAKVDILEISKSLNEQGIETEIAWKDVGRDEKRETPIVRATVCGADTEKPYYVEVKREYDGISGSALCLYWANGYYYHTTCCGYSCEPYRDIKQFIDTLKTVIKDAVKRELI